MSGKRSSLSSFFMKGRLFGRRPGTEPSSTGGERSGNPPTPPRRPEISLARATSGSSNIKRRVVVFGASRTGKTAIINQFLYSTFKQRYKETIEEMHHGEFDVGGVHLSLQILDTSGTNEFPAMRNLSILNGDGFILVYDLTDPATFEVVRRLRDQIIETKGTETVPMVIVGNKSDMVKPEEELHFDPTESVVTMDWEHGYVEASAKENINIDKIFQEVLHQAKVKYDLSPALRRKRRQSLPHSVARSRSAGPSGSSGSPSRGAASPSSSHSRHSRQRRDKQGGSGRKSCITS